MDSAARMAAEAENTVRSTLAARDRQWAEAVRAAHVFCWSGPTCDDCAPLRALRAEVAP